MAECGELQCESCQYEHVTKSASQWCTECEEGFCSECCRSHKAAKRSRNHHIIHVEEYQRTKQFSVNLNCPDHNKQLDFYCPTHDSVVCVVCVQSKHGGCEDLRPVNEAAEDAKTSTAFTDLEQTIDGLLENLEKGVRHLQQNKTNLEEQEDVTKKSIATKRVEINKNLDRLEENLLKELKSKSEKAMTEISLMTTKFETKRKTIVDLKDTAKYIKQFSSNLQVFVGIQSILKTAVNEINGIKLLVSSIPQQNIAVRFNPKFETLTETFDSLGEIQITSTEAVVPYVDRRLIQAQYHPLAETQVDNSNNLRQPKTQHQCQFESAVHKSDDLRLIQAQYHPLAETQVDNSDNLRQLQAQHQCPFEPAVHKSDNLRLIQALRQGLTEPAVHKSDILRQGHTYYQRPPEPVVHKIDNLQLKLRTKIKIGKKNSNVTSCLILPNKSVMIVSKNKPSLTILNEDGSHDRDITVPYDPYDVTIIDDQRVAVSYGLQCITIVNIYDQGENTIVMNVRSKDSIYGITYTDGKLYAVAKGEGIKVIDLHRNSTKTMRIYNNAINTYKVTTQKNKIYYSVNNGSVHCVNMEGTEIWMCRDGRLLPYPSIAVDSYGITFAAGFSGNLLLVISPYANQTKVLLTSSDGLQKPNAVYYDKDSKRLLVCNYQNGHAALYDVIY